MLRESCQASRCCLWEILRSSIQTCIDVCGSGDGQGLRPPICPGSKFPAITSFSRRRRFPNAIRNTGFFQAHGPSQGLDSRHSLLHIFGSLYIFRARYLEWMHPSFPSGVSVHYHQKGYLIDRNAFPPSAALHTARSCFDFLTRHTFFSSGHCFSSVTRHATTNAKGARRTQ